MEPGGDRKGEGDLAVAKKFILIPILLISLALWGCSPAGITPTPTLVQQALTLQIRQIHRELNLKSDVAGSPRGFKITRVAIARLQPLTIDGWQGFKVEGTYDLQVRGSDRRFGERHNPFRIYLQRRAGGRIWRLAWLENQGRTRGGDRGRQPKWSTMAIPRRYF